VSALHSPIVAQCIQRISRVVSDLRRSEAFYGGALGFKAIGRGVCDPATLVALGAAGETARQVVMRLGDQEIILTRFDVPGRPNPADSRSNDLWFQHIAIVVSDIEAAHGHLSRHPGWTPISSDGPQLLPPRNGSVKAFKFRDPDGHPLELIWFPPDQGRAVWRADPRPPLFMGIDHTALSVASTESSLAFYESLGFTVSNRSLNVGPAQDRLDGLASADAHITSLRPRSSAGPGIELLAYQPPGRSLEPGPPTDLVTDWMTIATPSLAADERRQRLDADGHRLLLVGIEPTGAPA
jgi:catechol 2,3-dioxygenase-like lactoylglutathione lyase family enzyme